MKRYIYILICVFLLPIGCKDDEEIAPAYREDLLDVQTDGSGRTITLLRDDGQRFTIVSGFKTGLPADTVLRVMAAYEVSGASAAVTAMQQVLVPRIQTYAAEKIVCAPVAVTACWQGGNYVNFKLFLTLINIAYHLTADIELLGFLVSDDALGGGDDGDAESVEDARHVLHVSVPSETRP